MDAGGRIAFQDHEPLARGVTRDQQRVVRHRGVLALLVQWRDNVVVQLLEEVDVDVVRGPDPVLVLAVLGLDELVVLVAGDLDDLVDPLVLVVADLAGLDRSSK